MRAKRSLGQNFLVDPNLQRKIVEALDPAPDGTIVEIGPGRGALTRHLVERVGRLVAVELDDDLAAELSARYADRRHVEVVHQDILQWDPAAVVDARTRVVGNIPYNISTPIIFRLLEWRPAPERIIIMVQKEVADRLAAPPGDRQYGALSVGVQAMADVERLFTVSRSAFRPVPNVESAVVRIDPGAGIDADVAGRLRALTRAAFGLRRKQMQKVLRTAAPYGLDRDTALDVLGEVGLRPEDRPEVLAPGQFVALAEALHRRGYPRQDGDARDG
ncbi:MAG TPA: 16S rRNA (adenine(1518)-N(6)/adenine(1519)-N(6))-dimethyltransferase RsmA [Longimicrobiales bacterium]|nr:16S rRNA (adenine(1518)-N(6)/adenine(1519)-N(6))-dimethyltransferase RsmA [Longimicrobiales bacterium]